MKFIYQEVIFSSDGPFGFFYNLCCF